MDAITAVQELAKLVTSWVELNKVYSTAIEENKNLKVKLDEAIVAVQEHEKLVKIREIQIKKIEDVAAVMNDMAQRKDALEAGEAKLADERVAFELERSQKLGELNQQLDETQKDRATLAQATVDLNEAKENYKKVVLDLTAGIK